MTPKEKQSAQLTIVCLLALGTFIFGIWFSRLFSSEPVTSATQAGSPVLSDFSSPNSVATVGNEPAVVIMNVSAYCPCEICCGKWADGITASGKPARGHICAAPPEYPFGTVMDVEGYGEYVVEDRGGAIKGNKLDLLFEDHQAAKEFGRKGLKVRIK